MSIVLLRSVDFETADEGGEIIEMGWTDVWFDTEAKHCEISEPKAELFKPVGELSPDAQGVHHITAAMLADRPPLDLADLQRLIAGADFLVAHNAAYEQVYLTPEITGETRWICTFKAGLRVWEDAPKHNLQCLRYWLGLDLPPELAMPAHRAGPDSYVGAQVLAKMLETERVSHLASWTLQPRYYRVCPLKKHQNQPWNEIPHGYLRWIRDNVEEFDLRHAALTEMNRRAEQGA